MPHLAGLYNLACWLTEDSAAAEDLVRETYAKALKVFPIFPQGASFRVWIYRILRNIFLTTPAGLHATALLESENVAVAAPAAHETLDVAPLTRAGGEATRQALQALPVHLREIILLSDLEEMTYKEIELALGIPPAAVISRLLQARRELRQKLAATSQGAPA
jgi:RNA polymerase sigma-70 factor (ECF subfamily)